MAVLAATSRDAALPAGPLLTVQHVGKRFGNDVVALADVSLSIRPREFLSVLGPSGCGKSTLLGLIGGLISPSEGSLDWPQANDDGRDRP